MKVYTGKNPRGLYELGFPLFFKPFEIKVGLEGETPKSPSCRVVVDSWAGKVTGNQIR